MSGGNGFQKIYRKHYKEFESSKAETVKTYPACGLHVVVAFVHLRKATLGGWLNRIRTHYVFYLSHLHPFLSCLSINFTPFSSIPQRQRKRIVTIITLASFYSLNNGETNYTASSPISSLCHLSSLPQFREWSFLLRRRELQDLTEDPTRKR